MKRLLLIITLLPCFALATHAAPLDKIAAVVNKDIITQSELNNEVRLVKTQMEQNNIPLPSGKRIQSQVLKRLIYNKLQLQIAKRAGIQVDSIQVDNAIASVAKHNHMTLEQFKQSVASMGISLPEYRKKLHSQLLINQVQGAEVSRKIQISDQQVVNFLQNYNKQNSHTVYHLKNILIPLQNTPSPRQVEASHAKAEKIITRLRKGANFKNLAVAHSDGDEALKGGDMGWHQVNDLPTLYVKYITHMHKGQIQGPIRTPNGFHIIKLVATKQAVKKPISKQQAKQMLFQHKFQEKLQDWLQETRAEAYVKVMV